MPPSRQSDQQLLDATYDGNADAFGEFFGRHADAVTAYLRGRLGSAEEAAELTAEVFAAALLAVHSRRAEQVPNGAAWLVGIARHKLIDSYRAASVARSARTRIGLPRIAVEDADLERIDRLAGGSRPATAALRQLSQEEREAIVERIVREREYAAIADEHGSDEATIRKRVSRGLARLRKQLGEPVQ